MEKVLVEEIRKQKARAARKWRNANVEHVREYQRLWGAANREKRKEYNARYWKKKALAALVARQAQEVSHAE